MLLLEYLNRRLKQMSEKYNQEQKAKIHSLIRRTFSVCKERGYTYRQVAPILRAEVSSVHRWFNGKAWPSQHHVYYIKKFLGIPVGR